MDARGFRDLAMAAFPLSDLPTEVVSDLAREVHQNADLMESALIGRAWTEVSANTLSERAKDIVALMIPAFVYYIPAFMCAALENPESDSATYAMYALCPLGNFDSFYEGTCCLFSPIQSSAIAAFLSSMHDDPSFSLFNDEMKPGIELWKRRANA